LIKSLHCHGRGRGQGGEMNQALYAHMNNKRKMKKNKQINKKTNKKKEPALLIFILTYSQYFDCNKFLNFKYWQDP
jgi:hypothetical protein